MAITLFQDATSTQYVQVQIQATVNGVAYNPAGDTVQMAFIPVAFPALSPGPADWHPATWETDTGGVYWATCLVGPAGGVALGAGSYVVWVKVTDSPAVPVIPGPVLNVTGSGSPSPGGGGTWVQSFNARTGIVVPQAGDYTAAQTGAVPLPTGTPSAGQVPQVATASPLTMAWGAGGGAVTSVFSRTGAVTAQTGDYTPAQVGAVNKTGDVMGGKLAPKVVTLTDAAVTAIDVSQGNDFRWLLGGSHALGIPSNPVDGQQIVVGVQQPASGGPYTPSWASGDFGFDFGSAGAPVLSSTASTVDFVGFKYDAAILRWCCVGTALGFAARVAFRAAVSGSVPGGTALSTTITLPAGLYGGDLVLVYTTASSAGPAWSGILTLTNPGGTAPVLIDSHVSTAGSGTAYAFWTITAAGAIGAISSDAGRTLTLAPSDGSSLYLGIAVSAYAGAAVDVFNHADTATASSTTWNAPTVTTTAAGDWAVYMADAIAGTTITGWPGTFRADDNTVARTYITDSGASAGGAGTVIGGGLFTASSTAPWAGYIIGLKPA